jgi:hypothetical protein
MWRRPRYRPGSEFVNGKIAKIALKRLDQRKQEASKPLVVSGMTRRTLYGIRKLYHRKNDRPEPNEATHSFILENALEI